VSIFTVWNLSLVMLILVIILTMIGPEARKRDHIKESGDKYSSEFSMEKTHSHGYTEGHANRYTDGKRRKKSEDTIENGNEGMSHLPEKTIE
jgi:hypothetical protein